MPQNVDMRYINAIFIIITICKLQTNVHRIAYQAIE